MKIALHGKSITPEAIDCVKDLLQVLSEKSIDIAMSKDFEKQLKKVKLNANPSRILLPGDDLSDIDFVLSLGGDGTMLDTIAYTAQYETPIVGINLGRLGFLATTPRGEINNAVNALVSGNFNVESRSLIHVDSNDDLFAPFNFGLNEFTIVKKETSSMIVVHTYVDGEYLNAYWADGLIISTPTGSTGYSLSCGGPLVHPRLKNFILTPVSPHNLNVRPIIVSDQSEITFEIEGRTNRFMVSLDSRSCSVDDKVKISVKRESFEAKLVRFDHNSYFDTLRQKLNWGVDARN
ncbi:inorganic polyphosphate kinase [Roseivirga seohaensis subsp. aquiponti]|uniref:NAD kinase n=1 Tax=Roseivirga seohaensis subsp. aquiponti TaxID=1566026 RepID=A0A0L8AP15_9BACT|nr:NAD kinase [Roseivirga seohaensis]KOF04059.1 inorganic polyphosphate kinase [Roseivirga seohaensis subsp. aquiponti]